ncbi:MAG: hypothetical protein ACM3Q1_15895 [Bacteroidales bacterium]
MAKVANSETAASTQPEAQTDEAHGKRIAVAIALGKELIAGGATKADAAWAMYENVSQLPRDIVVKAFVDGATLTEKGAMTYWYNCRRKAGRLKLVGEGKAKAKERA